MPAILKTLARIRRTGKGLLGLSLLLFTSLASADLIWDANKPYPVPLNDNSCWMASAANMMAADGWGDAQTLFNILRLNPEWQTHGSYPDPGFIGGYQPTAINSINGIFHFDDDEQILAYGTGPNTIANPRALIDRLLATATATEIPGDQTPEGPDDPVGIAFWWGQNWSGAHAITVWDDSPAGLLITDSDDGIVGPRMLNWIDETWLDYTYYDAARGGWASMPVNVGFVSFMADPEPDGLTLAGAGLAAFLLVAYRRRKQDPAHR